MARRNHLDDFTRGKMIGKQEKGDFSTNEISSSSLLPTYIGRVNSGERVSPGVGTPQDTSVRKVGGGRTMETTVVDDRYIILQEERARYQSSRAITQQLCTTTGRQVSRITVVRLLHKGGLFARRPESYISLKVDYL
ncbi:transposable element Tcb2 transposase [Trichonephila clavipes]|nr:transposable element Tcb2 transposase [Trichonephila clavipes]